LEGRDWVPKKTRMLFLGCPANPPSFGIHGV
jgi:hypothetical protein